MLTSLKKQARKTEMHDAFWLLEHSGIKKTKIQEI
jgi:hypothetical protein